MAIFANKNEKLIIDTKNKTCRVPMTDEEKELCKDVGEHAAPRMSDITWRIFRIMAEFVEGFQFLSGLSREVTIFGSARLPPTNRWYQEAVKLGQMLAKEGYSVVTGGGPGIMEATNKGAYEAGGESIGLNIQLKTEQRINPYVKKSRAFYYFFTRKVILAASAQAYVYFPGGFGTLDELTEILTLIQTKKSEPMPVVLVGREFWQGFDSWIRTMVYEKFDAVAKEDLEIYRIVDSAQEAMEYIRTSTERTFF